MADGNLKIFYLFRLEGRTASSDRLMKNQIIADVKNIIAGAGWYDIRAFDGNNNHYYWDEICKKSPPFQGN